MTQIPQQPLVVVLGATGTGKSQLAVEIAKQHNGEIINGDAMQLYAGLPVLTNKITEEEQQGIPHHLLGCIDISEAPWVVSTFVKKASQVIEEIRGRDRLPILVGGTHYYTQSLLFNEALVEEDGEDEVNMSESPETKYPILAESTEVLMAELRRVDPDMAAKWHPKDRRKIQRSLMIYLQTGRKASTVYAEQDSARETAETPSLRFDTLLFWVHTEQDVLRTRLDERVDTMVNQDVEDEVEQLLDYSQSEREQGREVDETRGIWVSIGRREFTEYIGDFRWAIGMKECEESYANATEKTKIATRQYAKKQTRWIRLKLAQSLAAVGGQDNLYLLDSTDVKAFDQDVVEPANRLTGQFLAGVERPLPVSLSAAAAKYLGADEQVTRRVVQDCNVCGITCATEQQWKDHIKSRKHRRLSSKNKTNGGAAPPAVEDDPGASVEAAGQRNSTHDINP